ncbi:MAG: radical SAM protein [Dehalococcoidales bacterium]|nr:radical SAM protein [Dehalococcoidales bacterium]
MTTRVLLVSPPFYKPYSARDNGQVQADSAPLGLGYIASYILDKLPDTRVKIIDYGVETYTPEKWQNELDTFKPEVVGISVLTLGYTRSMELARLVKDYDNHILTVAGGPHATVSPEDCLFQCDIVVRGEGEETFSEILQGRNLESIDGISYLQGNRVINNRDRERLTNLDALPFPAHHLFNKTAYKQYPGWGIIGSRGCPYSCIFCASPRLWGRIIKLRSPKNLVDEIEYLNSKLGVTHIVFQDDAINIAESRAFAICDEIISRGLHHKVSFECQVRANKVCVSLALFEKMREANFVDLTFGIETGSDKVMKSIQKSLTVQEAREAIKVARQAGIPTVSGFFMIGNWGENVLDVLKTWYFVARNNVDMKLTVCTPLPGTEFHRLMREKKYMAENTDWRMVNWVTPLSRTDKLSKRSISILYYLSVLLVHLPTSLSRGREVKAKGLIANIMSYARNRFTGSFRRLERQRIINKQENRGSVVTGGGK